MTIRNIIAKELRQLRWVIITGMLVFLALAILTVVIYHYTGRILEELPEELHDLLLNYEITRQFFTILDNYSHYIWSQWNAKNMVQITAVLVVIISSVQFASEASKNTMGFYLTRPISRRQGYCGKVLAGLTILFLLFGSGTAIFWIVSVIFGYSAVWGRLIVAAVIGFLWILVFYFIAVVVSVLNNDTLKAAVISGILGILLSVPGMFNATRNISLFYHMKAVEYYIHGHSFIPTMVIAMFFSGLFMLTGMVLFGKRDY